MAYSGRSSEWELQQMKPCSQVEREYQEMLAAVDSTSLYPHPGLRVGRDSSVLLEFIIAGCIMVMIVVCVAIMLT